MRSYVAIAFIAFLSLSVFSQEQTEIDSLTIVKKNLLDLQSDIQDSIKAIDIQISYLKMKTLLQNEGETVCSTILRSDAKLRTNPTPLDDVFAVIPSGRKVQVLDYRSNYWKIACDGHVGFTSEIYLEITTEMDQYKEAVYARNLKEEKERITRENKEWRENVEKDKAARKSRLSGLYGEDAANKIIAGRIWIGMTSSMARESIGNPKDINRSVGNWGTHEQWVYDNKYLYFENGKLTSWQD